MIQSILKILILLTSILNLSGCKKYMYEKEIKQDKIIIEKIKLDMPYEILSLDNPVEEIVMFEECGRPDIEKSNTVIGAHSGSAKNAYFNEIHTLIKGDQIQIYYRGEKYIYVVTDIKEINDTEISILNDKNRTMLTLLTCKIGDINKRIIVIATLFDGKN